MNPWALILDALGWGLLGFLVTLAILFLYTVVTYPFKARTKRRAQASRLTHPVFYGKREQ